MGNGTKEAVSSRPGPSASSAGSAQPPRALPQPLQRASISRLPAGLGRARAQMRQVEGEREEGAILGAAPTVEGLGRLWKTGGQRGNARVGFMKEEGMCSGSTKLSPPDSLSLG